MKAITIFIIACIFIFSIVLHRSIFSFDYKKIGKARARIWIITLTLLYYSPFLNSELSYIFIGLWFIFALYKKYYRYTFILLIVILCFNIALWTHLWGWSILLILSSLLIEEITKWSWSIIFKDPILPYDWVLNWLLLWSIFWIIEASRAWWTISLSELFMRLSTSLSIHILATILLLGGINSLRRKNSVFMRSLGAVVASVLVHGLYNIFQYNIFILIWIIFLTYFWISFQLSKTDRLLIN
jgi:hypothetical protein